MDSFKTLDPVELAVASGRWGPGTLGTIVEMTDKGALVEIADERGHTEDWLTLPYEALRPVRTSHQDRLPA
jgi:hypothetical protein